LAFKHTIFLFASNCGKIFEQSISYLVFYNIRLDKLLANANLSVCFDEKIVLQRAMLFCVLLWFVMLWHFLPSLYYNLCTFYIVITKDYQI